MSNKMWHDYVKKYMADHNVTYAVASKLAKPSYKLHKLKKSVVSQRIHVPVNQIEDLTAAEPIIEAAEPIIETVEPIIEAAEPIIETVEPIEAKNPIEVLSTNIKEEQLTNLPVSVRIAPYICFMQIFFLYLWTD